MERLDVLVRQVRDQTGNAVYSSTQGIRQREFVRHMNAAQTRIYNKILQEHSTLYTKKGFMDVQQGVAEYALPTDIFLKHNIVKVDYSHNGNPINYSPLDFRTPRQEVSVNGYPSSYHLRDGTIVLSPIPAVTVSNALRLNYQYVIPALDLRRATVSQVETQAAAVDTTVPPQQYSMTPFFGGGGMVSFAYGNGLFVAGGSLNGIILTSPDGQTWTTRTSNLSGQINNIAYGNGVFAAVGTGGVSTSSDGITWTLRVSWPAIIGNDVIYANGRFVACSAAGVTARSYDGITWLQFSPTADSLQKLTYSSVLDRFVVLGAGAGAQAWYSHDGLAWLPGSGTPNAAVGEIQFGTSAFVATYPSQGSVYRSTDGITWAAVAVASNLQDIEYGNGAFVTGVNTGTGVYRSTDQGLTWSQVLNINGLGIKFINGRFYLGAAGGTAYWGFFESPDGLTWTFTSTGASAYQHRFFNVVNGFLYAMNGSYDIVLKMGTIGTTVLLTLTTSTLSDESLSEITSGWVDWVSLVDIDGNQIATSLRFVSYDSTAGVLTATYTGTALTDSSTGYLVFGKNATTHSPLPDVAERYLTDYTALRIQMRDSNTESTDTSAVLKGLEDEILDAIGELEEDLVAIPLLDSSMLNYADDL